MTIVTPVPVDPRATLALPDPASVDRIRFAGVLRRLHRPDLADLYEHCATFYPSHDITSDGLIRAPHHPEPFLSVTGSQALACLEG